MEIRVAVIGNVDSGKSTMVGVLTRSILDDGRGFARSKVFKHGHEEATGRTSSIGQHNLCVSPPPVYSAEVIGKQATHSMCSRAQGTAAWLCNIAHFRLWGVSHAPKCSSCSQPCRLTSHRFSMTLSSMFSQQPLTPVQHASDPTILMQHIDNYQGCHAFQAPQATGASMAASWLMLGLCCSWMPMATS